MYSVNYPKVALIDFSSTKLWPEEEKKSEALLVFLDLWISVFGSLDDLFFYL